MEEETLGDVPGVCAGGAVSAQEVRRWLEEDTLSAGGEAEAHRGRRSDVGLRLGCGAEGKKKHCGVAGKRPGVS